MADEQGNGTKSALAVLDMIRRGEGVDLMAGSIVTSGGLGGGNPPNVSAAPLIERGVDPVALGTHAALPTAGAVTGAAVGQRVLGPLGRFLGAGVGGAVGEGANALVLDVPSMTGSRALDMAIAGGGAVAGQLTGDVTGAVAGAATRPFRPTPNPGAGRIRDAMLASGVPMKVSDVSANMAALERSVAQTPTGGQILRDMATRQADALSRAADDFLGRIASPSAADRAVTGERASTAIINQSRRTGTLEEHLWTQMRQMATDLPVDTRALREAANQVLLEQGRRLPAQRNQALMAQAQQIVAAGEHVAWQAVDAWRRGFGEAITSGELISRVPEGSSKLLYRAALTDLEQAAQGAAGVPGLPEAFQNVRRFAERRREIFRDGQVAQILETDPEQVVKLLGISGGPTAVKRAREAILGSGELGLTMPAPGDVEAWNFVRRHVLEGVFRDAVNPEFKGLSTPVIVGQRLDKAITRLGRDTLHELLTPTERQALENLTIVARAMRASEHIGALPGTSTTPQGLGFVDLMRRPGVLLGAASGGLLGGASGAMTGGAVGGFVSMVLVPQVAARLLTNPRAAEVIASPSFAALARVGVEGQRAAEHGTKALMKLGAIMAADYAAQGGEQ
jgi:hypothetical protein